MPKDLAIVLCNGSLNSAVAATLAGQRHRLVTLFVDTDALADVHSDAGGTALASTTRPSTAGLAGGTPVGPGSSPARVPPHPAAARRPGPRRRSAYDQLVETLRPFRDHTVAMPFLTDLRKAGTLPMAVDPRQSPDITAKLLELALLLAAAARFAAHYEAAALYFGLRVGPEAPELSRATEYVQIFTELLQLPCGQRDTDVVAPLLELEPWQVVDLGIQVGCPMERTWSCYTDLAEPCGVCPGCRARDAAFEQAGKPDALKRRLG